ncbi:hypothetical protein PPACK8108_LOCUS10177 [Phakopsora pachyrhizi]|uniref:N-acetylglucosamine kinase n=1 Tax=Phakopsora pachyrhizi TaxID=170000 RepID=A0AAV0B1D7_PHAPC|nr:hypothetical protein PPACK8108_LOCUS10177 [Phakopsora pachyrhizi]
MSLINKNKNDGKAPGPSPMLDSNLGEEDWEFFLCIDGGGTKTKVTISGRSLIGEPSEVMVLSRGSHRASNYTDLGLRSAMVSIAEATLEAIRRLKPQLLTRFRESVGGLDDQKNFLDSYLSKEKPLSSVPFSMIWAGLSGVDSQNDVHTMENELSELFGIEHVQLTSRLRVTNDCDLLSQPIEEQYRISLISERDSQRPICSGGIVLIAGTGSIAMAFKPKKGSGSSTESFGSRLIETTGRLGGYGYLIGDEGSSFDVGRQTVKSILNWVDHQTGNFMASNQPEMGDEVDDIRDSRLLSDVLEHFEVAKPDDLLGAVYRLDPTLNQTEHDRKVRLAQVSRVVMGCAFPRGEGEADRFAVRMMNRSAEQLTGLLVKICEIHKLRASELVLCLGGGMYGFEEFKELLISVHGKISGSNFGWVKLVDEPDQVGALSLGNKH